MSERTSSIEMQSPRIRNVLVLAWILVAVVLPQVALGLTLSLNTTTLTAEEVTAGGSVLFFGVESVPIPGGAALRVHRELVADTDNDRRVSYTPSEAPSWSSVWWVADAASGETAVAAPEDFGVRVIEGGVSSAVSVVPEPPVHLAAPERTHLELALVRPGAALSVWALSAVDGGRGDAQDVADGELSVDLSKLEPLGPTSGTASALAPGDVLLLIDSQSLEVQLIRQGAAAANRGGAR